MVDFRRSGLFQVIVAIIYWENALTRPVIEVLLGKADFFILAREQGNDSFDNETIKIKETVFILSVAMSRYSGRILINHYGELIQIKLFIISSPVKQTIYRLRYILVSTVYLVYL